MFEMELLGFPYPEIESRILRKYPQFAKAQNPKGNLLARFQRLKATIISSYEEQYLHLLTMHLSLYEFFYHYFYQVNYKPGIQKALTQKEKLLGLLNDDIYAEIEHDIIMDKPIYNFDKLEPHENERLMMLLAKAGIK
jgi:hypothetical protein